MEFGIENIRKRKNGLDRSGYRKKTGADYFEQDSKDRDISFNIIFAVEEEFGKDCQNLSHKIIVYKDKLYYSIIFCQIIRQEINFESLNEIKKSEKESIKDIFLFWSIDQKTREKSFELEIHVFKHPEKNKSIKDLIEEKEKVKEIEEILLFRKKIECMKPINLPTTWIKDRIKIEDIIYKIYSKMEDNPEDIPDLSFSLKIENEEKGKKYIFGVSKLEKISLSFLKTIRYTITFSCRNEQSMFVSIPCSN